MQSIRRLGWVLTCGAIFFSAHPGFSQATPSRPNIVLIMADDMGYSDIAPYGGEIDTPNLDRLAKNGMRFTQFYNNAKCAPTRASLLTGLYSQQAGVHNGPVIMRNSVTLAEVLRTVGYHTFMVGKWHAEELPTERGFDRYYGLADGCCNFFNPGVRRSHEPQPAEKNFPRKWSFDGRVEQPFTPEDPDFYTTDAFTNNALAYLNGAENDDEPFFLYVAYTAPHYPLHARPEDIAKYRGTYRVGWDAIREARFQRMVELGLVDKSWGLSPRDPRVPAWEDVEDLEAWDLEALNNRANRGVRPDDAVDRDAWDLRMAVYAAMIDRMDQNIGRIVEKIEAMGELDNTLIMFLSDNGACAELANYTQGVPPGPVESYRSVDPPWANAQNTPFRLYKRYDHEGGIATPFIAHWPEVIARNTTNDQMAHIIDVMATVLDITGAEYPTVHRDGPVTPHEGKSILPLLHGSNDPIRETLFWQFSGSRAVREGQWKLVGAPGKPWSLYNMKTDRTEQHDLAAAQPDRVAHLSSLWDAWADRVGARR